MPYVVCDDSSKLYPQKKIEPGETAKDPSAVPRDCGFPNEDATVKTDIGASPVTGLVGAAKVTRVTTPPKHSTRTFPIPCGPPDAIIYEVNCAAANQCYPDPKNHKCTCDGQEVGCPQCADGPRDYLGAPGSDDGIDLVAKRITDKQMKICHEQVQAALEAEIAAGIVPGVSAGVGKNGIGIVFKVSGVKLKMTGQVTATSTMADGSTVDHGSIPIIYETDIDGACITIPVFPIAKIERFTHQSYTGNTNRDTRNLPGNDGKAQYPRKNEILIGNRQQDTVQVLELIAQCRIAFGFPVYTMRTIPSGDNSECKSYIWDTHAVQNIEEYLGWNSKSGTLGGMCTANDVFVQRTRWDPGAPDQGGDRPIPMPAPTSFQICPEDGDESKIFQEKISEVSQGESQPLLPFLNKHNNMVAAAEEWYSASKTQFSDDVAAIVAGLFTDDTCRIVYSSSLNDPAKVGSYSPNCG